MSSRSGAPQPADTAVARKSAAIVAICRAMTRRAELDLAVGVVILGLLAGLVQLGPAGLVLGLPVAAAALARNIRPDIVADGETRLGRVLDIFTDALWFAVAAGLLFYPGYLLGAAASRLVFGGLAGE